MPREEGGCGEDVVGLAFTQGLTGLGRVRTRERCDCSDQSGRPECRFRTCTDAEGGVGGVCISHLETVPVPCVPHLGCSDSVAGDTGLGHLPLQGR